jgi:signal transduction histidine kinase
LRSLRQGTPAISNAIDATEAVVEDGLRASAIIARIGSLVRDRKPKLAPVDLNAVIRDVMNLTRNAMTKEKIVVRKRLEPLPQVQGDAVQLQQVLLNLINNAIEAMTPVDSGSRVLTISSHRGGDGFAHVEVEDTGVGLDGVDAARVFESFYTTKEDGLGMGLSISHSIIEAHGGQLSASSGSPQGARFHFTVPLANKR